MTRSSSSPSSSAPRISGVGRLLVLVYGILALAATGRSAVQISERFGDAPVAFSLSAVAAVVYIVATTALVLRGPGARAVAWATITFELVGVLVVGTLSVVSPDLLGLAGADPFGRSSTVWSLYGAGYVFIPLALPVLGLLWLARHRDGRSPARSGAADEPRHDVRSVAATKPAQARGTERSAGRSMGASG